MTEKFKKTYIPHHKENETLDAMGEKIISGSFQDWFMQATDIFEEIQDITTDYIYGYITEEDTGPLLYKRYMQLGHLISKADAALYILNRCNPLFQCKSVGKA